MPVLDLDDPPSVTESKANAAAPANQPRSPEAFWHTLGMMLRQKSAAWTKLLFQAKYFATTLPIRPHHIALAMMLSDKSARRGVRGGVLARNVDVAHQQVGTEGMRGSAMHVA